VIAPTELVKQVNTGTVDAGLLPRRFVTTHAKGLSGVGIPGDVDVIVPYEALRLKSSSAAKDFLRYITSDASRATREHAGFLP